jgi:hypothetical protein
VLDLSGGEVRTQLAIAAFDVKGEFTVHTLVAPSFFTLSCTRVLFTYFLFLTFWRHVYLQAIELKRELARLLDSGQAMMPEPRKRKKPPASAPKVTPL